MPAAQAKTRSATSLAKRKAMLDAGMRCLAQLGLRNCTMDDFAAEAGVSRITLYREFKNRDEFIHALQVVRFDEFNERFDVAGRKAKSFAALLQAYLVETARNAKQRELTQQYSREPIDYTAPGTAMHDAALAFWQPIFANAQAEDQLPGDFDPSHAVQWILVMQATVSRLAGDGKLGLREITKLIQSFVLPAFSR